MKTIIASLISDRFLTELRAAFPSHSFVPAATEDEQKRQAKDADVFFGYPSREVFLAAERLRWIHCPGTGIDRLMEIPELADSDVVLTNARGPHANAIADHVFGFVLTFAHRLRVMWADQKAHRWDTRKHDERIMELGGSTMGILALGDIGRAVARRAHAFGMTVYAVDKRPVPRPLEVWEVWTPERLDDLMRVSDWFVVAAPFTAETKGLIDRRRIGLMKRGAYLIAVSRGGIVDEAALLDALRSGQLAGAGMDVFEEEPLPSNSPFWEAENVLISPHSSALTPQMWEARRQIFRENFRRFTSNEPFIYVCDKRAGF
ncbi:MAG: D-2-hydroxyacid dehydrogenase [Chloroflexi bacterium]|nr:D-2-hydroxyacid dehydrogenase [Chloroflexota bacterium]